MQIENFSDQVNGFINEVSQSLIFGNEKTLKLLITAYLCRGHVLLEGTPGVGKTKIAKLVASVFGKNFKRVQFTSDLLPGDILGSHIYSQKTGDLTFLPGPIFTDVLLGDEINRTPPRTQSALLEAMEERQVTIEGEKRELSKDFFVIATQNPLEFEGVFPLPEAQVDRFLFKLIMSNGSVKTDTQILLNEIENLKQNATNIDSFDISQFSGIEANVKVDKSLLDYIARLLDHTRRHQMIQHGASIRAGIGMCDAARVYAAIEGRDYVIPEDIKEVATPILRHRLKLNSEAMISGVVVEDIITDILNSTEFPSA
ncbi:MoxR family ATPase [Bacteriovorax sp. DB6_IX]|uniref:AAA family ATPase n=1 Tax=Bacteriovorax sp. DB6_IX TaxID=1353530 RepID=UPI000389FCFC|nr:MoxR family ATPase [Bacteriovorax sp. DB6_IX]EQC50663.1 ATPase, AAA family [Bacteriovorax sp. DB6_IX]